MPAPASLLLFAGSLLPITPGFVSLHTRIDCASISRLPCTNGTVQRSSALYTDGNRSFVVATPSLSEREAQAATAHEWIDQGKTVELKRLAGDFATNIDLYEISDLPTAQSVAHRPQQLIRSDLSTTNLTLEARTETTRREVRLFSARSDRTFIPLVPYTIEIRQTARIPIKAWSGTGVYDPSTNALVGLVSDEFLEIVPGAPTQLIRYSSQAQANLAVVLPEIFVRESAQRLLAANAPMIRRVDDDCFEASGIRSCELCDTTPISAPPSSPQFPVGGANGSGVGGLLSSGRRCKMTFSPARAPRTTPLPTTAERWFSNLRRERSYRSLEAWYSIDDLNETWVLTSAAEFFRVLNTTSYRVPIQRTETSSISDPRKSQVHRLAEQVALDVFNYLHDPHATQGEELFQFVGQVYTQSRLLQSDAANTVKIAELETMLNHSDTRWFLIGSGSRAGTLMKKDFKTLIDYLKAAP